MKKNEFKKAIEIARLSMLNSIKRFVLEYGDDFSETDYYRNEFGLEECDDEKVLKVIDIFNNGGCYFPTTTSFQVEQDTRWESVAFHCLYVVEEDGERELMYYALYNDGMEYDSDISEPEHGYVRDLSYEELVKLIKWLDDYCEYV
jgi:hypothetical protein